MKDFYWLNKDSRKFLSKGYLQEGQTAEERIRQIADYAQSINGIEGFADKFYAYMAKGYYSLSSPVWSNFGAGRALPISCVTGDTWILTDNGGKQAKDIKLGDRVLTHKNRYKKVTDVIITEDKDDLYSFSVLGSSTKITITGNHKVLTNLGWVAVENLDKNVHIVATNATINDTTHL